MFPKGFKLTLPLNVNLLGKLEIKAATLLV